MATLKIAAELEIEDYLDDQDVAFVERHIREGATVRIGSGYLRVLAADNEYSIALPVFDSHAMNDEWLRGRKGALTQYGIDERGGTT